MFFLEATDHTSEAVAVSEHMDGSVCHKKGRNRGSNDGGCRMLYRLWKPSEAHLWFWGKVNSSCSTPTHFTFQQRGYDRWKRLCVYSITALSSQSYRVSQQVILLVLQRNVTKVPLFWLFIMCTFTLFKSLKSILVSSAAHLINDAMQRESKDRRKSQRIHCITFQQHSIQQTARYQAHTWSQPLNRILCFPEQIALKQLGNTFPYKNISIDLIFFFG